MSGGCPVTGHGHLPEDPERRSAGRFSRRGLIGGGLGAVGAAAALAAARATADEASAGATSDTATLSVPPLPASYPFHGDHQAGIVTPQQRTAAYVAFDATAADRTELRDAFRALTAVSRFLTTGGTPPDDGLVATSWTNGVLGPETPPDGLTVTASVGASLFDERYGLAKAKPARLRRMEAFPNDDLDPARCHGDLLLQIGANNSDTVLSALRLISRHTHGALAVRWRQDGFFSPPRPSGTPRNLLGFKDGTANPPATDADLMDRLVWAHGGGEEPAWVEGGSYHVVRIIRMYVEFWDRVSQLEQENMIGRSRTTGAPLTGTHEFDVPDYALDSTGDAIKMDAHIRLANPRTPETADQRMLRRPFNYDAGTDLNGHLDMGLIFTAFNQDLERQFVTVQRRLIDEPLVDYISPVGGGYFFALPGVRNAADWLGRGMFA